MTEIVDDGMAESRGRTRWTAALVLAAGLAADPVAAQTVCVVCDGPEKAYSCSFAPSATEAAAGARGERALQVRCITELAQRFGHAQCKVNANAFASCAGEVFMLSETGAAPPTVPDAAARSDGGEASADTQSGRADAAEGAPKTVVELAKRAAGATQKQIEESGSAVEQTMRQTWRCVTSLFARCSDEEKPPGAAAPGPSQ